MHKKRDAETDKPAVVIQWTEQWNYQAYPRKKATQKRCNNSSPIPSAIYTAAAIEVTEMQIFSPDKPVISYQNPRDRTQSAGVSDEPAKNVARGVGEQLPRLHQNSDDTGDEAAC